VDLSARYCDILKDTLYVEADSGVPRRSAQTVLWELAVALTKLAAPILAFTCDEVWDHLAARAAGDNGEVLPSVHLALMPPPRPERLQPQMTEQFDLLWRVRDEVLRELEALRKRGAIGAGLDADVALWTDDAALAAVLRAHAAYLPRLFIVSRVAVAAAAEPDWQHGQILPALRLNVRPARGHKCARCWNYSDAVGVGAAPTDVCQRCRDVMRSATTHTTST
jgi:isoleucyl-tRNA synthetase